jgi:hypothetical protein
VGLALSLLTVGVGNLYARSEQPRPAHPASQSRVGPKPNQEHLAQWMQHHQNLTPEQQQKALENEPGFRQLPPQTQQRMRDRLAQLNAMSPEQRTHVLERAEQIEHLNPQQRQQVRGAMAELGRLPPDRRAVVARVFRDMRDMPTNQRQAYLSSDYLHRELSPEERGTLNNLMAIEPLLPAQRAPELAPPPPQ